MLQTAVKAFWNTIVELVVSPEGRFVFVEDLEELEMCSLSATGYHTLDILMCRLKGPYAQLQASTPCMT